MSGTGPEILPGLIQRSERVLIPTLLFPSRKDIPQTSNCYTLFLVKTSYQQTLYLVQMKLHYIRAFAASYGGVSVCQMMQHCHWKAHNTLPKRP